jgi:hypothetical protein
MQSRLTGVEQHLGEIQALPIAVKLGFVGKYTIVLSSNTQVPPLHYIRFIRSSTYKTTRTFS